MYNNKYLVSIFVVASILLASCGGGKPNYKVSLKNDVDSASYYFGYFNGKQLAAQGGLDDLNTDAIAKGWRDAQKNVELVETDEDVNMFMQKFFMNVQTRAQEKSRKEGQDFLEANKKKQGVVTLPSGLQYRIIEEGSGIKPTTEDVVDVVYHGTLIDGTVFDSSIERNDTASFEVNGVVAGFSEALTLMNEGSKWEVFIPSDLGYGEMGRYGSPIKPNSVLIFEIDLVKVIKAEVE